MRNGNAHVMEVLFRAVATYVAEVVSTVDLPKHVSFFPFFLTVQLNLAYVCRLSLFCLVFFR